jgi:hypothetical protein
VRTQDGRLVGEVRRRGRGNSAWSRYGARAMQSGKGGKGWIATIGHDDHANATRISRCVNG